ncbi:MAG: hypothetical protein IKE62_02280 [Oscillospiraceae bacterium]|nr:hypothetical protein [Oscillospiraceae bacterium]
MTPERPAFGTGKILEARLPFANQNISLPAFEHPISVKENFYRTARRDTPRWVPFPAADMQELHMAHLAEHGPPGRQLGPDLSAKSDRYTYLDSFGSSWTWDRNAGGACMTIGTRVCDDILKWEEQIRFPDLHEWDLEETARHFMATRYDPERILHLDIYHGPFQALSDLLGSFADALEAMFEEPEACRAFFDRFTDWLIWLIDKLSSLYPADMFTVHDDWGTERDTFFSPHMMETLLFEPTKKVIDHVHSLGKLYQFHCCGKVDRFMSAMCELGPDFVQLQRRVNDTPGYKKLYGSHLGFNTGLEGLVPGVRYSPGETAKIVKDNLDMFAQGGGFLPAVYGASPETMWDIYSELYLQSRRLYERG